MDEETSSYPKVELRGRAERGSESGSEREEAEAEGEPDIEGGSRKADTKDGTGSRRETGKNSRKG